MNYWSGGGGKGIKDVMSSIKEIVPEAVCCRSHALTDSSIIAAQYRNYGIKYDLNKYIPPQPGICIFPYKAPVGGAVVLPFIFEDDIYLMDGHKLAPDFYLSNVFDMPRIFNFHPVHLFLNSDKITTYENAKPYYKNYNELKKYCNRDNYGARNFLYELVDHAKRKNYKFKKISQGHWLD